MTFPSGSTTDEAKQFLDAHPEIEAFDIVLTDANGVGRGKIIRRHELMSLYEHGRHLPISILGLDITGEDVHETGLIWDYKGIKRSISTVSIDPETGLLFIGDFSGFVQTGQNALDLRHEVGSEPPAIALLIPPFQSAMAEAPDHAPM